MIGAPTPTATGAVFEVTLDAAEPFLDDHRPDGRPLLGVAMSLELIARSVRRLDRLPGEPTGFERIVACRPYVLSQDRATITISASCVETDEGGWQCTTASSDPDGDVTHIAAGVVNHAELPPRLATHDGRARAQPVVSALDVYSLFFHGPAFQVIAGVSFDGRVISADVAPPLPLANGEPACASIASCIEVCMQAGGLLEIATRSSMMVPHEISSVRWRGDLTTRSPARAVAVRTLDGSIDVDLEDDTGAICLALRGYRTIAIPFPIDPAPIARLQALISGTAARR